MKRFAIAALFAVTATTATAQQSTNCADRAGVLERLESKFGEVRQSIGLGSNNTLIETFASPATGTWTITATTPDGQICILAYGSSFEATGGLTPIKGEKV
jgi:hypothetical protein